MAQKTDPTAIPGALRNFDDLPDCAFVRQRVTGNQARVRRYCATHRRVDYVRSPDVMPIIEHHRLIKTAGGK